ncbi:MAG: hypothetical protein KatS3mg110_1041 [Pirellulaceae bacterium]|nr:MAG: hypothetical protein KatS3mg110_1041 [Pirellulaceae bacterium]
MKYYLPLVAVGVVSGSIALAVRYGSSPPEDVQIRCPAATEPLVVPSDQQVRIPFCVLNGGEHTISIVGTHTSCGCAGLRGEDDRPVRLPLRLRASDSRTLSLLVDTHGRTDYFPVTISLAYTSGTGLRYKSVRLQFQVVSEWWIAPATRELVVEPHQEQTDCWLFIYLPAGAVARPSITVEPVLGVTRMETYSVTDSSSVPKNLPTQSREQAPTGFHLAYAVHAIVGTPLHQTRGSAIIEFSKASTTAGTTMAIRRAAVIAWRRGMDSPGS